MMDDRDEVSDLRDVFYGGGYVDTMVFNPFVIQELIFTPTDDVSAD